jgi:hypothetical protein
MFDALNMFHDGTAITADISPTSLTRSGGSAALDLRQSPAKGWAVVMVVAADLAEASDTLLVSIEDCTSVNGTYRERARFPLLTKGTGMPGTYIIHFDTDRQFVRAKIDVTDADAGSDFTVTGVYILLCPPAFKVL